MNPLNPIFAIVIYGIAFLTAYLINLKYKITNDNARFENIDALRGFLALGVFIHHSAIWYQYLQIKNWEAPKSNLYNQLGQTSVSFFFMITAFLFITKLLNTNERKFDWKAFFISRLFRLVPMYILSLLGIILIVLIISHWEMKAGVFPLVEDIFYWSTFTIIKQPVINGVTYTSIINAGVVWSLPFEWLFYFSLPLISLLILKSKPSIFYILVSLLFVVWFYMYKGINEHHIFSFIGGAITPFILKYGNKKIKYNALVFSFVILLCFWLISFFGTSDDLYCKILITIIFNLIVLGNNLFGILKSTVLKFLGEIGYSTYLIHGITIFSVMYFGYGLEKAAKLSPMQFCLTIFFITPFVVGISFLGYKYIERPFMNMSKKLR